MPTLTVERPIYTETFNQRPPVESVRQTVTQVFEDDEDPLTEQLQREINDLEDVLADLSESEPLGEALVSPRIKLEKQLKKYDELERRKVISQIDAKKFKAKVIKTYNLKYAAIDGNYVDKQKTAAKKSPSRSSTKTKTKAKTKDPTDPLAKDLKPYEVSELTEGIVVVLNKDFALTELRDGLKKFILKNKKDINIDLDSFSAITGSSHEHTMSVIIDVIEEFSVEPFSMKTIKKTDYFYNLSGKSVNQKVIDEALAIAKAKTFVRYIQDAPSNIMNQAGFVSKVQEQFKGINNVKINVISQDELTKMGLHLLVGVNKGSQYPCKLITIEYNGNPSSTEKTAYIGKGVCFDSGGYNIKTGNFMKSMKFDISGAAIVAGTLLATAQLKPKINLVGVMGIVENVISPTAQRPDDIITSYKGMTVEIDNTDAEGRLVMADCL
ncbi:unnamed protein product [Didymodactylos carnosus]|uniref:Cytosol aminopeptidase domain-containing protein n=1 Tax=Didymodactylos carnosus TaxID=1234261 RepID=A0A8S2GCW1_9BILA|nr:unnamed protein product [Didymodactylos carnosus]CAF3491723.1 unnamed protein product [Didymodactylos carnosus]